MAWNSPSPGIGNTNSYIGGCDPFLSSSNSLNGALANNGEIKIQFPRVTRHITVVNKSGKPLYVHFDTRTNTNVINNGHYTELTNEGDSWAFNIRCKEFYLSMKNAADIGAYAIMAEMTAIPIEGMYTLSGSGVNN